MGLKLCKEELKKNLNISFILKIIVLFVFSYISIFAGGQNIINSENFGMILNGFSFLFIFFAYEFSKDSLQKEKKSKRLEWFLSNKIKILDLVLNYGLANFILTNMVVSPIIILFS